MKREKVIPGGNICMYEHLRKLIFNKINNACYCLMIRLIQAFLQDI